jgi:hypothetical protein
MKYYHTSRRKLKKAIFKITGKKINIRTSKEIHIGYNIVRETCENERKFETTKYGHIG